MFIPIFDLLFCWENLQARSDHEIVALRCSVNQLTQTRFINILRVSFSQC